MPHAPTVLLVEDDEKLAGMVSGFLREEGFVVAVEPRGDVAVERIIDENPDAVLLDIRLPGMDGLSVCRAVRSSYGGAILMLTARGDEIDEVAGLELGADDYLRKPARPRVLLARLRAVLRRGETAAAKPSTASVGPLQLNHARREASLHGRLLDLSTAEFDLLALLVASAGRVVDRDTLYRELAGQVYDGLDRSIDLRVSRLRKKLGDRADRPAWIKSVRGVGYQLAPPVKPT